jgi:hypothetical protein
MASPVSGCLTQFIRLYDIGSYRLSRLCSLKYYTAYFTVFEIPGIEATLFTMVMRCEERTVFRPYRFFGSRV